MSQLDAHQIYVMARGEVRKTATDWGENTSGAETGVLKSGDTVSSCTAAIATANKPSGATDLTLSAVTVPGTSTDIDGRTCTTGEWTQMTITSASDQAYGQYKITLTATTTNGETIKRNIIVNVGSL